MRSDWFSKPQLTKEAAQALHDPGCLAFDPAAVFETPAGNFVMGLLQRNIDHPPLEPARALKELLGYTMVSYCDSLFGLWKDFEPAPKPEQIDVAG